MGWEFVGKVSDAGLRIMKDVGENWRKNGITEVLEEFQKRSDQNLQIQGKFK